MQRKKTFQYGVLLLGICSLVSGFVLQSYGDIWPKIMIAIGCVLLSFSIPFIVVRKYLDKNPDKMENSAIKQGDERRKVIHDKASAKAGWFAQWFILVVAIALLIAKTDSWVIYLSIALFIIQSLIRIFYLMKYSKEM